MRRKPRDFVPDLRADWQKEQGARCPCRGLDDLCACQNENPWPRPRRDLEGEISTLTKQQETDRETIRALSARAEAAEARNRELEERANGYAWHLRECEQIAGKALDYPWFKDDPKNFPDATEADGVCVGEHVGDTIVAELAAAYLAVKANLAIAVGELETFAILVSEDHDHLPDELVVSLTYDSTDHDPDLGGPNELLGERFLRAFRRAAQALSTIKKEAGNG